MGTAWPGMVTCPQKGECRWGLAQGQLVIPEEKTSSAVEREPRWPKVTAWRWRGEGALSANIEGAKGNLSYRTESKWGKKMGKLG